MSKFNLNAGQLAQKADLPDYVSSGLVSLLSGKIKDASYTFDVVSIEEVEKPDFKDNDIKDSCITLTLSYFKDNTRHLVEYEIARIKTADGTQSTFKLEQLGKLWAEHDELSKYPDLWEINRLKGLQLQLGFKGKGRSVVPQEIFYNPHSSVDDVLITPVTHTKKAELLPRSAVQKPSPKPPIGGLPTPSPKPVSTPLPLPKSRTFIYKFREAVSEEFLAWLEGQQANFLTFKTADGQLGGVYCGKFISNPESIPEHQLSEVFADIDTVSSIAEYVELTNEMPLVF